MNHISISVLDFCFAIHFGKKENCPRLRTHSGYWLISSWLFLLWSCNDWAPTVTNTRRKKNEQETEVKKEEERNRFPFNNLFILNYENYLYLCVRNLQFTLHYLMMAHPVVQKNVWRWINVHGKIWAIMLKHGISSNSFCSLILARGN